MNALIVHYSMFGHTKAVAEAIGQVLGDNGTVRVIPIDDLGAADLADVDVVVMGTPTHNMNLPEAVKPLLDALPRRSLRDSAVAAFDTSYKMSGMMMRFTAAKRLDRKLRKLGGQRVVPPETFFVEGREGPLYEGELDRARQWAATILGLVQQQAASDA